MISLKWLIQSWHALILAMVLIALGVGFYFNERAHRLTELDFTLDQQIHPLIHSARVLQGKVPSPGARRDTSRRFPNDLPQPSDGWQIDHNAFALGDLPRSPKGGGRVKRGPFAALERRFEDLGFYSIIWDATGDLIYRSEHAPEMEAPMDFGDGYMKRIRDGQYREIFHAIPTTRIVVGFDLKQVYADLDRLKWQIAGVMCAIYVVSLLVGGWLVSHSLSPLKAIQRTSESIAEGKLKERIPENNGSKATELVHLTRDLNDTFAKLDRFFQRQIRFTADASHELRTPLTALIGHIKLGRSRTRSVQDYQDILETCERAAHRIQRITDDLLELSRYDSGRFELECEPLSLEQLLAGLAEDLQPVFAERGSSLATELQPVTASCDPFRLEQVITNLINNALQHNPSPIAITLRLSAEPNAARIDVVDNGKGIQPDNLDKLFDRFFQESDSRARSRRSLNVGLGLSISQAIMEAHGGTISATSKPGIETVFTIRLPLDPQG